MHTDIHLQLHTLRGAELRREAAEFALLPRDAQHPVRNRVGWTMVELGLRLVHQQPLSNARVA